MLYLPCILENDPDSFKEKNKPNNKNLNDFYILKLNLSINATNVLNIINYKVIFVPIARGWFPDIKILVGSFTRHFQHKAQEHNAVT